MEFNKSEFVKNVRNAGIVGAGGAGFPAYFKANSSAETVLVNAAECEPLLKKDQTLLELYPQKVVDGLSLLMKSVGAGNGIIGIKKKHEKIIKRLEEICSRTPFVSVCKMGDFYPAGDEFCLVYEATGKVIPPGGIPLDVGCVVNNVETLYNMAEAGETPVVEKYITINGAVKKPATFKVPVGISYGEAVELAGGFTVKTPVAIDGGPMMGRVITDFEAPVTKTSAGLIVLPADHPLIKKKSQSRTQFSKIGRSACDQCSFCTEFCPRYMLGHKVQPHRVMRSLLFSPSSAKIYNEYALLCCECSLCSLYACPEGLNPREVCVSAKADLRERKINFRNSSLAVFKEAEAHPLRDFRKVPVKKLVTRLGLKDYDKPAPYLDLDYKAQKVKILLSQHIGTPCEAVVKEGESVRKGQAVGDVAADKLGCPVHASIDGRVSRVNSRYIEIKA